MITVEQAAMIELPAMPAPSFRPIFLVISYYVGPGGGSPRWKVHKAEWLSEGEAKVAAARLNGYHLHRRIVRIG